MEIDAAKAWQAIPDHCKLALNGNADDLMMDARLTNVVGTERAIEMECGHNGPPTIAGEQACSNLLKLQSAKALLVTVMANLALEPEQRLEALGTKLDEIVVHPLLKDQLLNNLTQFYNRLDKLVKVAMSYPALKKTSIPTVISYIQQACLRGSQDEPSFLGNIGPCIPRILSTRAEQLLDMMIAPPPPPRKQEIVLPKLTQLCSFSRDAPYQQRPRMSNNHNHNHNPPGIAVS